MILKAKNTPTKYFLHVSSYVFMYFSLKLFPLSLSVTRVPLQLKPVPLQSADPESLCLRSTQTLSAGQMCGLTLHSAQRVTSFEESKRHYFGHTPIVDHGGCHLEHAGCGSHVHAIVITPGVSIRPRQPESTIRVGGRGHTSECWQWAANGPGMRSNLRGGSHRNPPVKLSGTGVDWRAG